MWDYVSYWSVCEDCNWKKSVILCIVSDYQNIAERFSDGTTHGLNHKVNSKCRHPHNIFMHNWHQPKLTPIIDTETVVQIWRMYKIHPTEILTGVVLDLVLKHVQHFQVRVYRQKETELFPQLDATTLIQCRTSIVRDYLWMILWWGLSYRKNTTWSGICVVFCLRLLPAEWGNRYCPQTRKQRSFDMALHWDEVWRIVLKTS